MLVVDDEEEIIDFLQDYFKEKGYSTHIASSREKALELVHKHNPDVVLLDVRLTASPGVYDGIDILGEIRKHNPLIKVIMVTAVEDKTIVDRAMQLGASDYITKPLSLEYLENTVTNKIRELVSPSPSPQKQTKPTP